MRHAYPISHSVAVPISFPDDPITNDLRSFALELAVPGASVMSKDELVESLRQHHALQQAMSEFQAYRRPQAGSAV